MTLDDWVSTPAEVGEGVIMRHVRRLRGLLFGSAGKCYLIAHPEPGHHHFGDFSRSIEVAGGS